MAKFRRPTWLTGLMAACAWLTRASKGDGFLGLTQSLLPDGDSPKGSKPNPRGQLVGC